MKYGEHSRGQCDTVLCGGGVAEMTITDVGEVTVNGPDAGAHAQIDALSTHAWDLRYTDAARALELAEQAHARAAELGYAVGLARSLYVRGSCHFQLSSPQASLEDVTAALAHYRELADEAGVEEALAALGMIYAELGEVTRALGCALARYELCRGRGDAGEAEALSNLGVAQSDVGNYAEAADLYRQAWRLTKHLGDKMSEAYVLNNVGYAHYRLGEYDEALGYYLQALEFEAVNRRSSHALLLDNIGLSYEKLGDLERAVRFQQQSLNLREEIGDKRGVGQSLDGLGSAYLALGRGAEARACLERSLELKEAVGDKKGQTETCTLLGSLELSEGRPGQAKHVLQRALALAEGIADRECRCDVHRVLARAHKLAGDFSGALEHLEHHHALRDELSSEVSRQKLRALHVTFETERAQQGRELYRLKNVELAHANTELAALAASLHEADRQKSRLLRKLERQAQQDALTRVYNRRYFDARLAQELTRARRSGQTLSVVLCDVDDFKGVNDGFSHQTGDKVLKTVARIFKRQLRKADTVARYGGEEFALLLPETDLEGARLSCERIRVAVQDYPWDEVAPGLNVTLSLGFADTTTDERREGLLKRADDNLYHAKHGGKNQICG